MARKRRKKHRAPSPDSEAAPTSSTGAPARINSPFREALGHLKPSAGKPKVVERAPDAKARQRARDAGPTARRPSRPAPAPKAEAPSSEGPPASSPASPDYSYEDRVAYQQAYAGVQPLGRRRSEPIRHSAIAPTSGREGGTPTAHTPAEPTPADRAADAEARARLGALVGGGVQFDVHRDSGGEIEALRKGAHPSNLRSLTDRDVVPEATLDLHGEAAADVERLVTRFVRARHRRGARVLRIVHGKGRHSAGGVGVLGEAVERVLTSGGAAPLVLAFASAPPRLGGTGALVLRLVAR